MCNKYFTDEQVKELESNPYVVNVTPRYINYSEEFKELFLIDYYEGMLPIGIFKKYGFNKHLIDSKRRSNFVQRIKNESKLADGFKDMRKENSGRPRMKDFLKRVRFINRNQFLKMHKNKP